MSLLSQLRCYLNLKNHTNHTLCKDEKVKTIFLSGEGLDLTDHWYIILVIQSRHMHIYAFMDLRLIIFKFVRRLFAALL